MNELNEIVTYLKNCGTFYLATTEGNQPRVRPFGAVCEFEGKLYIITNNKKAVYAQLLANPCIELSGMHQGTWIRISGKAIPDHRIEARIAMMNEYQEVLGRMYSVDDTIMEVLYLEDATATIFSFQGEPKVLHI